jgi:hypothetical protein
MACYEIMIFPMEGNPGVYNLMHHLYVSVWEKKLSDWHHINSYMLTWYG